MHRANVRALAAVVLILGGLAACILGTDSPLLFWSGFVAMLVGIVALAVVSPSSRQGFHERVPWISVPGRAVVHLRGRAILGLLVLGVAVYLVGDIWGDAVAPETDLLAHIDERYRAVGAAVYADPDRAPLRSADALEEAYPADDQHYVPIGVLLRYERHIVAVLPDGRGGSELRVMDDDAGYRTFYRYVGRAWGPAYDGDAGFPTSTASVPPPGDERDVRQLLDDAERAQDVCYGWRVEIRSGRGRGASEGTPPQRIRERCGRYVVLEGWIDPLAGRVLRRGPNGDYDLVYRFRPDTLVAQRDIDAISVGPDEVLLGSTTEPTGSGERPGKGLLDQIAAMPLLMAESGSVPPVPVRSAGAVPRSARPAPAERSDAKRRADDSGASTLPDLLGQVGLLIVVFVLVLLPVGAVRWLVRRLRG